MRLLSLVTVPLLAFGAMGVLSSCTTLPDACRDMSSHMNVHDGPSGIGVSHIDVWAHVCFYANTDNTSPQTSVSWSHSEYGALQLGIISHTEVDMPAILPRAVNSSHGANWVGGFHVKQCSGAGPFEGCSFGTDFGCYVHSDSPLIAGFGYAYCNKVGGHNDFYIDTSG